jgi:uncharacterized protein (DUF1330 family)
MTGGPIDPTERQLADIAAVAGTEADGPIVMLNLNRYRDRADYGDDGPDGVDPDVSGREAYGRYGEVAMGAIAATGGAVVWFTESTGTVIGRDDDRFDEVVAVWYPSRAAFLSLVEVDGYAAALSHRTAALERAMIICTEGPEQPRLEPLA